MKKITNVLFCLLSMTLVAQSKTTNVINLGSGMTANFTLNNTTSKVTLILTGPADRWFGLGLGVVEGFSMGAGDVVLFTTALTDRNFVGTGTPATDTQDWATISNTTTVAGVRTLTLERALTTADTTNDLQMPFATTNSIDVAWARNNNANNTLGSNHSVGFASATFSTLGVEDFSLSSTSIYPNPACGEFNITAKTGLTRVKLYNQLGALIKTVEVKDDAREVKVDVNGIQSGIYLLELQNDSEKSWKKIILN